MREDDLKMATKIQRALSTILHTDVSVTNGKCMTEVEVSKYIRFGVRYNRNTKRFVIVQGPLYDIDEGSYASSLFCFDYSTSGFSLFLCMTSTDYIRGSFGSITYDSIRDAQYFVSKLSRKLSCELRKEVMIKFAEALYMIEQMASANYGRLKDMCIASAFSEVNYGD